jgi:predicted transcriptional regulator
MKPIKLTAVEQEFMEILWRLGEATVHDILEQLPAERTLAYTSASTMLRILQQKEMVTARKEGRRHIYKPKLSKRVFARRTMEKLVRNVFDGSPVELVANLIAKEQLSKQELDTIQRLLNEKKKELEDE